MSLQYRPFILLRTSTCFTSRKKDEKQKMGKKSRKQDEKKEVSFFMVQNPPYVSNVPPLYEYKSTDIDYCERVHSTSTCSKSNIKTG